MRPKTCGCGELRRKKFQVEVPCSSASKHAHREANWANRHNESHLVREVQVALDHHRFELDKVLDGEDGADNEAVDAVAVQVLCYCLYKLLMGDSDLLQEICDEGVHDVLEFLVDLNKQQNAGRILMTAFFMDFIGCSLDAEGSGCSVSSTHQTNHERSRGRVLPVCTPACSRHRCQK